MGLTLVPLRPGPFDLRAASVELWAPRPRFLVLIQPCTRRGPVVSIPMGFAQPQHGLNDALSVGSNPDRKGDVGRSSTISDKFQGAKKGGIKSNRRILYLCFARRV